MSDTTTTVYTAITFAPVQGFIEKSRKLRDLYGSSFILSYLSEEVCKDARRAFDYPRDHASWPNDAVVSPALIDLTQGVPNQILIRGNAPYEYEQASKTFYKAWGRIVSTCQNWIQAQLGKPGTMTWDYGYWNRFWEAWAKHAWEFFWAVGSSADEAKETLNERKFARAWTGINWTGESSTLSGIDGRAWPHMGKYRPYERSQEQENEEVYAFYTQLMNELEEATITPREFLSIPELVKRLVTVPDVINYADPTKPQRRIDETPLSFKDLNRLLNRDQAPENDLDDEANREEAQRWTGWFQGDGDRAGSFLLSKPDDVLHAFSLNMRMWGRELHNKLPKAYRPNKRDPDGRIIYAGGDDFLGVFYRNPPTAKQSFTTDDSPPMTPLECVRWFETFKSRVWEDGGIWGSFQPQSEAERNDGRVPITVSVGFVWAAPKVPQRDVLQHCREAEQSAKRNGRDRVAFRILFNDGKHLEWVCPWWLLEGNADDPLGPDALPDTGILAAYRDRNGVQGYDKAPNWTHLYNDVAALEARHGFRGNTEVALGLVEIYFGEAFAQLLKDQTTWWNRYQKPETKEHPIFTGILGDAARFVQNREPPINSWIINLAKVGFHLTQTSKPMLQAMPSLSANAT